MVQDLLTHAMTAARAGGEVLLRAFGAADLRVEQKAQNDYVTEADRASEAVILEIIRQRFPGHAILAEEGGWSAGAGGAHGAAEYEWVIDPLDGTTNFARGVKVFCVSVACRRVADGGGEMLAGVVYDPLADDLFTAARGFGAQRNGHPIRVSEQPGLRGAFLATGYPFKAHPALDNYLGAFRDIFLEARAIRRCGAAALDLAYTAAGIYDGFFEFRLSPWDLAAGALLIEEAGGRVSDLDGGDTFLRGGNVVAGSPGVHRELRSAVARHASEAEINALCGDVELDADSAPQADPAPRDEDGALLVGAGR